MKARISITVLAEILIILKSFERQKVLGINWASLQKQKEILVCPKAA